MDHPALDIIQTVLGDAGATAPDAFRRLKADLWDLPVWVPGHATERGGTNFLFQQEAGEPLPKLSMFSDEQEARELCGAGPCMAIPFKYAIYLANEKQYDLDLFFHRQLLSLKHDMLLEIRDLVALQASGEAMMPQEALRQIQAVKKYIELARSYCQAHQDIISLRIAIVVVKTSRPRVAAVLDAPAERDHDAALTAMAGLKFPPAWRFRVFHADGDETAWIETISKVAPCYHRDTYASFRDRLATMFGRVGRIETDFILDCVQ
jgi:hypothetical protein